MIITDTKKIFEEAEVGDYLEYYADYSLIGFKEDNIIISEIIEIEECDNCGKNYICNKMIFTDDQRNDAGCFMYPDEVCAIKSLIKKEDFITKEDLELP